MAMSPLRWYSRLLRYAPWVAHLIMRGAVGRAIARATWAEMERSPRFQEGMRAAQDDRVHHRVYLVDTSRNLIQADPEWSLEGEQPSSPRGEWVEWK